MTELPSRSPAVDSGSVIGTARPSTTNPRAPAPTSAATAPANRGTISASGADSSASSSTSLAEPVRASDTVIIRRMGKVY